MRAFARRHAPALATAIALSAWFVLVYGGASALAGRRAHVESWSYAWERHIPFVPILIVPYMSIDLFFFAAPFLCRTRAERRVLAKRLVFGIAVAGLFFVFLPFRYAGDRPMADGPLGPIFRLLHGFDAPFNMLPSLHITLRTILADVYARRLTGGLRWASAIWFSLIGLSTVLVYQHHVVDIVGGFMLAAICFYLFPQHPTPADVVPNRPLARRYAVAAILCAAMAFAWPWWSLWMLWPALSLAIAASSYAWFGPSIYRKRDGRLPLTTRLVLAPFLLGQRVSLWHYARRSNAFDVLDNRLLIGRRLSARESRELIGRGPCAVVDLTGEFSSSGSLRSMPYCNVQVSDLTAPSPAQLDRAVAFVREHRAGRNVFIHCKAGYSRTAAVAGATMLDADASLSADDAIARLRAARRGIVIRPEIVDCLHAFANRRVRPLDEPAPVLRQE